MMDSHNTSSTATFANLAKQPSFEQLALGQYQKIDDSSTTNKKWHSKLLALPAYYWVLLVQVMVVFPHAAHLPLWLMGFAVVSIMAQLPPIKAKFRQARHLKRLYQGMQMLGFLLGLAGLWLTYNAAFGLDMGVAFLVLCLISKLWEL